MHINFSALVNCSTLVLAHILRDQPQSIIDRVRKIDSVEVRGMSTLRGRRNQVALDLRWQASLIDVPVPLRGFVNKEMLFWDEAIVWHERNRTMVTAEARSNSTMTRNGEKKPTFTANSTIVMSELNQGPNPVTRYELIADFEVIPENAGVPAMFKGLAEWSLKHDIEGNTQAIVDAAAQVAWNAPLPQAATGRVKQALMQASPSAWVPPPAPPQAPPPPQPPEPVQQAPSSYFSRLWWR
jgi:hypothetical protein